MKKAGLILMFIAAMTADSENLLIPFTIAVIATAMILAGMKKESK